MIVISTGCPAGIGPEISIRAAARLRTACILVGDWQTLNEAAELCQIPRDRLMQFDGQAMPKSKIAVKPAGPKLTAADRRAGKPTRRAGHAQLAYVETAFDFAKAFGNSALVTAPVSKAVIAHSGLARARQFLGHTEWLEARDGAKSSTMCFATKRFVTSLVTTHLPVSKIPRAITARRVAIATCALAELLAKLSPGTPNIAVCSLNPHAGESSLLGQEESTAIIPGLEKARRALQGQAVLIGPIGAETAYRKAQGGQYQGVVAMYHDQATIPTKLVAFGEAVNVTWGLSIVRTSVDHGTGYDIAWTGNASDKGMLSAISLAHRLI
jgi:4-hydroxythreonine-4-phosphate dehydrogenase